MKQTRQYPSRNIIGIRVRKARLLMNPPVSQDDLAGRLARRGVVMDRSAISRIENRTRYVMDYEAKAIAQALKVSIAWLYAEES